MEDLEVEKFTLVSSDESSDEVETENVPRNPALNQLRFSEERSSMSKKFYSTIKSSARQTSTSKKKEYVLILNENRARQIGFAALSLFDLRVVLGQILDSSLYLQSRTLLNRFNPLEVFLPRAQKTNLLTELIRRHFPDTKLHFLVPNFFEENKGFLLFTQELGRELPMSNSEIYLSLACLNCLDELIKGESIESRIPDTEFLGLDSLQVEFFKREDVLELDVETIRELRLLENKKNGPSLIRSFYCLTVGGYNLLRSNLIQPLQDKHRIFSRMDFIGIF